MIPNIVSSAIRRLSGVSQKSPDGFLGEVLGVVHVGANTGQEREVYNTYGLNVIWIEPIPEVFTRLSANIQGFGNQLAFPALVTDVDDKEYEIYIANNDGASSSMFDLKEHKDIWPEVRYESSILLKSITLATLFAKRG